MSDATLILNLRALWPGPGVTLTVKLALKGALNTYAKPLQKAETMTEKSLHQIVDHLLAQNDKRSIRDRALLLTGFYGALENLTQTKNQHGWFLDCL